MDRRSTRVAALCTWLALAAAAPAAAQTAPFVEEFPLDAAGWHDNLGFSLDHAASGGPDGSSFAWGDFDFTGFIEPFPGSGAGPIVFRAQDEYDSSGGAFEGDWDLAGVTELRAQVRHDAPVGLTWILRIANTFNFPAAAYLPVGDPVVPPDTWTELVFEVEDIDPCVVEAASGSFTCLDALMNVAHVQLGTDAPQSLIDDEVVVVFDVDKVELVPEPGSLPMLAAGCGLLALLARRARREACA